MLFGKENRYQKEVKPMIYQPNFTSLKRASFLDIVALLFISIFLAGQAHAAVGDLDTSFNGTGKVFTNLGVSTNWSDDIKVLADNKFLLVGSVNPGILLVRYNSDGTPDASFGSSGLVISNAGSAGVGVDVQSDGKIIVVGQGSSGTVILRFNPNGSPDNTFGSNGVVSSSQQGAADVAIQTDDKIVIVGYPAPPSLGLAVRRFNSDGSVDTGFGNSGIATTTFGQNSTSASKVALQSDGKIVVAGTFDGPGGHDFVVARFNVNGSLDGTFGGGNQRVSLNGVQICQGLTIQSDGKIILAGTNTTLNDNYDFFLVRFNPNGTIDTDFGGGLLTVNISPGPDYIFDVAVQNDGKILAFGQTQEEFLTHFIVTRLNSNGSFDTTFGSGGKTIVGFNPLSSRAIAAGLRNDGQIISIGNAGIDLAISQISPTGTIQVQRRDNFGRGNDTAQDVAVQPDGKIVAVGYSQYGNSNGFSLARYLPNGALDNSFGIGGKATTQFNDRTEAFGIALQPDGKMVVVGRIGGYPLYRLLLVRYNADGSLDKSFGTGGSTILSSSAGTAGSDVAIQPDGKIAVAGMINQSFQTVMFQLMVARFNADGSRDSGFANNGIYVANASPANALAIQPDGKIVAGGAQLIRLTSNGAVDSTFNSGVAVTLALTVNEIALQPDGKIALGGTAIPDFAIARYNSNGAPDSGFGANGITFINFGNNNDVANSLVLQSDGAIIAGGYSESGSPVQRNFALARVTSNGILDNGFGIGGKIITALGTGNEQILGLALQRNGRLVAVGEAKTGTDFDYVVTRYFTRTESPFDFDGDGKTDISIFRPSNGEWWLLRSSDGGNGAVRFGNSSDKIVPADYTGDGKTDTAIWRPSSGVWFVLRSEDFSFYAFPFGSNGDTPAPGDYDGDGKADATVFRPSSGTWYINRSSDGGTTIQQFGQNGDVPVAGDYDADGKTDIAIYRVSLGEWWIQRSTAGTIVFQFGNSSDKPVQGDYTGDGRDDVAFWRPSTGEWFVLRSENQSYYAFHFGANGDVPAPGDYDGDGKFDAAIFRPTGSTWYIQRSTAGILIRGFGQSGDLPVPGAFVP
jgi:uncharacterized delta-60 repeat protein